MGIPEGKKLMMKREITLIKSDTKLKKSWAMLVNNLNHSATPAKWLLAPSSGYSSNMQMATLAIFMLRFSKPFLT